MHDQQLDAYARLLLEVGVNLQPGQCLAIGAEPVHVDFLCRLTEEAYRRGAKFVRVDTPDPRLGRARVDHAEEAHLGYVPSYAKDQIDTYIREGWARIVLGGSSFPDLYDGVDTQRMAAVQKRQRETHKPLMKASLSGRCRWTVAALPTAAWAAKVLETEASAEACAELWDLLVPILRLDRPDPCAAWREQSAALQARAEALAAAEITGLRFTGPGTDLEVGLIPGSRFCGGAGMSPDDLPYIPNLPTEEVFTTPDLRRTTGRAQVTRPVRVLGSQVRGAWFRFEEGRVVEFGAEEGADFLEKYFGICEQARYLGEVALVDCTSPIFQSGRIFESILFDENAACHIALGSGITMTLPEEDRARPDDELLALGCNVSLLHTDFMIGSEEISVTGLKADGTEHPIIRQGRFVLEQPEGLRLLGSGYRDG